MAPWNRSSQVVLIISVTNERVGAAHDDLGLDEFVFDARTFEPKCSNALREL
jgi:hypothetical protein